MISVKLLSNIASGIDNAIILLLLLLGWVNKECFIKWLFYFGFVVTILYK